MKKYKTIFKLCIYATGLLYQNIFGSQTTVEKDLGLILEEPARSDIERLKSEGRYEEIYPSDKSLSYALPSKFDISTDKAFPPIGKQKGPVCASYSTVYYNASYLIAKRDGLNFSSDSMKALSPYYVYAMAEQSGKGIGGTLLKTPMEAMMYHGALTHEEWSMSTKNYHRRWNTDTELWRKALTRRMERAFVVYNADTPEGVNEIKRLLLDTTCALTVGGPDSKRGFNMRPLKTNPQAPENAKYPGETGCIWSSMGLGGHAMALVGYNDDIWLDVNDNNQIDNGEMGAWKIANSYGVEFPEIPSNKGFHWVSYDATRSVSLVEGLDTKGEKRENVFLGNKIEGFQIKDKNYKPKVLAEITVKTAGRMDPRFTFFKTTTSDTPPFDNTNSWKDFLFGTKAGSQVNRIGFDAVNYDDSIESAPAGTFMFDITEHVPESYNSSWRFGVSVQDKYEEKPTEISSVKVIYLAQGGDKVFKSNKPTLKFDYDTKNFWVDVPGDATTLSGVLENTGNSMSFTTKVQKNGTINFSINSTENCTLRLDIFDLSGRCLLRKSIDKDTKTFNINPKFLNASKMFIARLSGENGSVVRRVITIN